MTEKISSSAISRRNLLKTSAFVGGTAVIAELLGLGCSGISGKKGNNIPANYVLSKPENILYSTCLQCHVDCQIKCKTWNGVLAKLSGNPYSPQNYLPHLPYDTNLADAALADGKLCGKGQAGIQTYADPYRVRKVLKRNGPRGSNKWKAIEFERFVEDVVAGGKLFSDIGDDGHYPGFDEVCVLRDPALSVKLASDAAKVAAGEMTLADFKGKHRVHLDKLIDPDHPDLGPKNNQLVFLAGRIEHGRKEFMRWFTNQSFGSINAFEHTTICEQSHHIAYSSVTGHVTHHLKPDLANCEFVLFWGTGAFSANFGLTPMAEKVTTGKTDRGMKTAVIDPRLSHDAGKADWWLPIKPGTDGALALGMIRWILENRRYDGKYLANANKAAAKSDGEPTWSDASYLVVIENGKGRRYLRASEVKITKNKEKIEALGSEEQVVVMVDSHPVAVTANDDKKPLKGELFVSAKLGEYEVKSSLQLLKDEAFSLSLDKVAEVTGVSKLLFTRVARELTSHGKRAAVEIYRGPVQHTDGYYAGCAIILLNVLLGNPDYQGGLAKGGGHWHESGGKPSNVYNFKEMHPNALKPFGVRISREKNRYEDTTLFQKQGYPAKRPWYPFSSNVYQEVIPSFSQGYPYPGKILITHKGTPVLSTPAGHRQIEMLRDSKKVPLFIASDIVIGETSMYADYIVPDLTFLERWATPHTTPDVLTKTSKVRQPVAKPLTQEVTIDGESMPISMEAFLIAIAKKLGISGFGKNAFGKNLSLDRPEDWYLKLIANIAVGDKQGEHVPDASEKEMAIFVKARRHLPPSVFEEQKWKNALYPKLWKKVVYVLNRGGRFAAFDTCYDGNFSKARFGDMFYFFVEHVAKQKNSISGKHFSGVPIWRGQRDCSGNPIDADKRYPFALITYKEPFGGHSRTISNYWGNIGLASTNYILINSVDAQSMDLRDGQQVRVVSAANPKGEVNLGNGDKVEMLGTLKVIEGLMPGVLAISWHFGHWAYGSREVQVDGNIVPADKRRGTGLCPNPLMLVDPKLGDVCLSDPIGGSASFYDTKVGILVAG